MPQTILIADNNPATRNLVNEHLEAEGFRVAIAANGREALHAFRQEKPDLILLDINLPDRYDFIKACHMESEIPFILLIVNSADPGRNLGLEFGADGYIAQPFDMKVLIARINEVLPRAKRPAIQPETVVSIGGIHVNKNSGAVKAFGRPVSLTPSEFDLLYALISAPGKVFSRSELLLKLQDNTYAGTERSVDVHIRNLRTKIEPNSSEPIYIKTVFRAGYCFHID